MNVWDGRRNDIGECGKVETRGDGKQSSRDPRDLALKGGVDEKIDIEEDGLGMWPVDPLIGASDETTVDKERDFGFDGVARG